MLLIRKKDGLRRLLRRIEVFLVKQVLLTATTMKGLALHEDLLNTSTRERDLSCRKGTRFKVSLPRDKAGSPRLARTAPPG